MLPVETSAKQVSVFELRRLHWRLLRILTFPIAQGVQTMREISTQDQLSWWCLSSYIVSNGSPPDKSYGIFWLVHYLCDTLKKLYFVALCFLYLKLFIFHIWFSRNRLEM